MGLLTLMYEDKADFTATFRSLSSIRSADEPGSIPPALEKVCLVLEMPMPLARCANAVSASSGTSSRSTRDKLCELHQVFSACL